MAEQLASGPVVEVEQSFQLQYLSSKHCVSLFINLFAVGPIQLSIYNPRIREKFQTGLFRTKVEANSPWPKVSAVAFAKILMSASRYLNVY